MLERSLLSCRARPTIQSLVCFRRSQPRLFTTTISLLQYYGKKEATERTSTTTRSLQVKFHPGTREESLFSRQQRTRSDSNNYPDYTQTVIKTYLAQTRPVQSTYALSVINSVRLNRNTPDYERKAVDRIIHRITQDLITRQCIYDVHVATSLLLHLRALGRYEDAKELWRSVIENEAETPDTLGLYYPALITFSDVKANSSLDWLETLFTDALSHPQAGPFAEYQAQPNALLTFENGRISNSGIDPQIPLIIGAIARARVIHGRKKEGYMAMDSTVKMLNRFPKFLCESILDPSLEIPLAETYRMARLACRDTDPLMDYKVGHLLGQLRLFVKAQSFHKLATDQDLANALKPLFASLNLIITHLDAGGKIEDDYVSKVVLIITGLIHPEALIYSDKDAKWIAYAHALAKCAEDFVTTMMPFVYRSSLSPYQLLLNLSVQARDKELYRRTMATYFTLGGSPVYVASSLVKGAGIFGNPEYDAISTAWAELKTIRQQNHQSKFKAPVKHDFIALAQAIKAQPSPQNIEFFNTELAAAEPIDGEEMLHMIIGEATGPQPTRSRPLSLDEAQKHVEALVSMTIERLEQIRQKPDSTARRHGNKVLNHDSIPMSLNLQVLGSDEALYHIYSILVTEPGIRSAPGYSPVPFENLAGHQHVNRRFRNWVSVTELLAEAEDMRTFLEEKPDASLEEKLTQSFKRKDEANRKDPFDGLFEPSVRFTDKIELEKYIRRLREIS